MVPLIEDNIKTLDAKHACTTNIFLLLIHFRWQHRVIYVYILTCAYSHISIFDYLFYMLSCIHAHSCLTLCECMDIACHTPLSMGLRWQEYQNGLPFPLEEFPHPGIETASPLAPELASVFFTTEASSFIFRCSWIYTDVSSSNLLIHGYV